MLGTTHENTGATVSTGAVGGGVFPLGVDVLFLALGIILVGSVITVIQRIVFVRRQAQHQ
jgi:hypothetical protein